MFSLFISTLPLHLESLKKLYLLGVKVKFTAVSGPSVLDEFYQACKPMIIFMVCCKLSRIVIIFLKTQIDVIEE